MWIRKTFLILLSGVYLGMAYFIFSGHVLEEPVLNHSLAGLFLVYGGWRMYRAFRMQD